MLTPAERIHFWTDIMRDHAEFILMALSSREKELIRTAQSFKDTFTVLHDEAKGLENAKNPDAEVELAKKAEVVLTKYIEFKKLLLKLLLQCSVELNLPPTFVNHMINEANEFMRDLNQILCMAVMDKTKDTLMLHRIWLPDAAGHAASIASELDPVEIPYIKQAQDFKKAFNDLNIKACELGIQLERAGLENGALEWFNLEVTIKINEFIGFLDKIKELRQKCRILGTLKPLMPDHMIREEKYYLASIDDINR